MKKKSSNKGFSLKREYIEALGYLKESRTYIYVSIILFLVSILLGFLLHAHLGFLDNSIRQLLAETTNLRGIGLVFFILGRNLLVSILTIVFGIVLGVFPIYEIITNGVLIGYVIKKVSAVSDIGTSILLLLPHGIFELPAIFISFGLGIKLGFAIFAKNPGKAISERFIKSIKVFILIILVLLIVAAIIEGTLITLIK